MSGKLTSVLFGALVIVWSLAVSGCGRSKEPATPPATNQMLQLLTTNISSPTVETNFPLRSLGSFHFTMPNGWKAESREAPTNEAPAITIWFSPADGEDYLVEFTAFIPPQALTTKDLRLGCEGALEKDKFNALEKNPTLQPLKGPEVTGFYFSITDKHLVDRMPPRGEYKYMVRGNGKLSAFGIAYSIVSNDSQPERRQKVLEMIRTVRFVH